MLSIQKIKLLLLSSLLGFITFASVSAGTGEQSVSSAYSAKMSKVQVVGSGVVIKVLADDNVGSRHQRFLLKLSSGQTVLIAHNIDLAPKISGINVGDNVAFNGEYEWNAKGGVIHWTHHDPAGRHQGGWLKHNGQHYQ